jgi:cbb3-type cytochrome oxidase subunit 3
MQRLFFSFFAMVMVIMLMAVLYEAYGSQILSRI